jgi:thiamine biosynthesis protein ThiS
MQLQINGDEKEFAEGLTLGRLVGELGMKADRVAIELNREIIVRTQWAETTLHDGDKLEIVHFVGGG